jgi:hypothetical protein
VEAAKSAAKAAYKAYKAATREVESAWAKVHRLAKMGGM